MTPLVLISIGCSFEHGQAVGADATEKDWWNPSYLYRRQLTITTGAAMSPANTSMRFVIATQNFVGEDTARLDARDWRIVRRDETGWTELDRWIDDGEGSGWNGISTRTWFSLPVAVAANESDTSTFLYYGHADEQDEPAQSLERVFLFGDDFEHGLSAWTANEKGELAATQNQIVRAGTSALSVSPGSQGSAGLHRDQTLPPEPLRFSFFLRQGATGSSFGAVRAFSAQYAQRSKSWSEASLRVFEELDSSNRMQNNGSGVISWFGDFNAGVWRRVEVIYSPLANQVRGSVDDSSFSPAMPAYAVSTSQPIQSLAMEGEGQGGTFQVDNYIVRKFVDPEPTVTVGFEERR